MSRTLELWRNTRRLLGRKGITTKKMRHLWASSSRIATAFDASPDDDNRPAADATELQILFNRNVDETTLADGTPIRVRPILPQDKDNLRSAMARLSADARYRRFMSTISELSPERLRYLTEIDYEDHFALTALALDQEPPLAIGFARYVRDPDKPHVAEPAFSVVDAYQGRGLGNLLLQRIMADALANGITHFRATLFADNQPMKEMFMQQNAQFSHDGFGTLSAEFVLPKNRPARMDLVQKLARHAYKDALLDAKRK